MAASTKTKALTLLESNKSVKEIAGSYLSSIKRNLQASVIDNLKTKIDTLTDRRFSLQNFNLTTNLNNGVVAMSREECEKRFKDLIDLEYELSLTEMELKIKTKSFNEYFGIENQD